MKHGNGQAFSPKNTFSATVWLPKIRKDTSYIMIIQEKSLVHEYLLLLVQVCLVPPTPFLPMKLWDFALRRTDKCGTSLMKWQWHLTRQSGLFSPQIKPHFLGWLDLNETSMCKKIPAPINQSLHPEVDIWHKNSSSYCCSMIKFYSFKEKKT